MSEEIRETKTIETPVKKQKIVINAWLNGLEKRELRRILYGGMKIGVSGKEPNISDVDMADLTEKAEDKAIEFIVISVDGDSENVLDKILKMQDKDYSFVIAEINKVSQEEGFTSPELKP